MFLALSLALSLGSAALAAPVDFTGRWRLDLAASTDVAPLLEAQGRPWIERKLSRSFVVKQDIAQADDVLEISMNLVIRDYHETNLVDGVERPDTQPSGEPMWVTHWWEDDAQQTRVRMPLPDGHQAELHVTRTLEDDGQTMRRAIRLQVDDGRQFQADRVFRRLDQP